MNSAHYDEACRVSAHYARRAQTILKGLEENEYLWICELRKLSATHKPVDRAPVAGAPVLTTRNPTPLHDAPRTFSRKPRSFVNGRDSQS